MAQQSTIRLLIADDQEIVRSGLKGMLADTESQVVAAVASGQAALKFALENHDVEVALTQREGEVPRQMASGLTNKQIAVVLHISYETVKEHVLRKIGVDDRTQAAVWAVRNNLT
jgi:DNA-binding NarL/FixJ family response regulator